MVIKIFNIAKYKFIRFIEKYPNISILIYNNISYFDFLLPHEKDYFGMLKILKSDKNFSIIDVGANLGISTMGFRKLGFKNPIYLIEPNIYLYENFLKKLKKKDNNIFIKNLALGNKNIKKKLHLAFYKKKCLHYLSSFSKKYIYNSINIAFPDYKNQIFLKYKNIKCVKFDSLNLKFNPGFVKLDTEGFDYNILKGFKKTIKKYKPIFLIEYNEEFYHKISKLLKNYKPLIYDFKTDKFLSINVKTKKKIARISKHNKLSNRNIYYVPENKFRNIK